MRKHIRRLPMLHPGMHALSPEMAIEDLRNRGYDHVVADGSAEMCWGSEKE